MTNVIDVDASGSGKLTLGDEQYTVTEPTATKAAVALIGRVLAWSHHTGQDIAVKALWMGVPTGLRVHPDWTVTEDRSLLAGTDEADEALSYVPPQPEPERQPGHAEFRSDRGLTQPNDHPTAHAVGSAQGALMSDATDTTHDLDAQWHSDGTATVTYQGSVRQFDSREDVLRFARGIGRDLRTPVRIYSLAPSGPAALVVEPSGRYYDMANSADWRNVPEAPTSQAPVPSQTSTWTPPSAQAPAPYTPATEPPADSRWRSPATEDRSSGVEYVGRRKSFVDDRPPELPPERGWRGIAAKAGIKVEVSDAERAERIDQEAVSQHWPGPRTIAIVNGKGGVGKTPTTICLSATFAKWSGIGALAWDNNQTRGTLGWRTERGRHESTTLDLIPNVDRLLGPDAQMADLAHYVHHQKHDRYDVLRSQPMKLAADQRITPEDVGRLHTVAVKYYRLIIIDSGNDESDPIWQKMIELSDQLVVATTTRDDHAEAGALLLEALMDQGGKAAELARGSVAIISQADVRATHDDLVRVRDGFKQLGREAVTVRYDLAMVDGPLRLANLKATTQRDWLRAAAAVSRGL